MKKEDLIYLEYIFQSFTKIVDYTQGITYRDFLQNEEKQDAVVRKIEIASEACKRLSQELLLRFHHVPWRSIARMWGKVVNDYFGVDTELIWDNATVNIPALLPDIGVIIKEFEDF